MKLFPSALIAAAVASLPVPAQAGFLRTFEAAGVQATTQTNVITEDFNGLTTGSHSVIHSVIGTYTSTAPGAAVVNPDAFGGSYQTRYLAVGSQSKPTTVVSLALQSPATYFGLYWAAADSQNQLEFYSHGVEVGSFTSAQAFAGTSAAYLGNPNNGLNPCEKYAYINFFGTGGTSFDRIDLVNCGTGTGFETDNHSVKAVPTMSAVPEPSAIVLLGAGAGVLALTTNRGRRGRTVVE